MSNVLSEDKKHQVIALGRLGWSLRRIEEATGVRRETASEYLKAAGIPIRRRGGRPREWPPKPATTPEVSTDSGGSKPAISGEASTDPDRPIPATRAQVSTDLTAAPRPGRAPSAGLTCGRVVTIDVAVVNGHAFVNNSKSGTVSTAPLGTGAATAAGPPQVDRSRVRGPPRLA